MEFLVLDKSFRTVAVIDSFESLIWTDRYSKCGDFEIYTSYTQENMENLKTDFYIWTDSSEHQMIIENRKITSDIELGSHLTITGRSLESVLDRRIVWTQTILNGSLEEQVKKLLNENVISPSDQKRKIENFVFGNSDDSYIESLSIRMQFTGDSVYDAVRKICDSVDIGFKVSLNQNNQFEFKLYSGKDRSYGQNKNMFVVFSPNFDNIIDTNYYESKKNLKNVSLVGGEGEGADRRTVVVGDEDLTGLDRREIYTDARDLSSETQDGTMTSSQYDYLLRQRGYEDLTENKIIQTFDGQVEATNLYRYGEDFFMGDITELENEFGMTSRIRVVEYIICEDQNGKTEYPTFEVVEEEEVD